MERLSPLDASFLNFEDGITHMHIASCALFEGPPPDYRTVVNAIASKVPQVPRYRQVVRFMPLQLGRPAWVDDPHFHLEYHVRHTALPRPGGRTELRELMGRLMSQELDRRRPLWEVWMVENLEDGHWALITKIHHCMADGVAGTDLLAVILDLEPRTAAIAPVDAWQPVAEPSNLHLVFGAAWRLLASPYEQFQAAGRLLREPHRVGTELREAVGGMWSYAGRLRPTAPMSLVGAIGPHRRWTWASAELEDVKAIRKAFGGTVNDVILSLITGGLRRQLLARGDPVDRLVVRSLVPVSVRSASEHGEYNNRVSAMFADLPVSVADPRSRLEAVRKQMEALKASHQTVAGEVLTAMGAFTPFASIALAERTVMRVLRRLPQHSVNTVTTNVPGPQYPLYLADRKMLEYLPFVPIAHGVRVGFAIVSYNGKIAFGVTGDYDSVPDIDILTHGIEDGITELLKLAAGG